MSEARKLYPAPQGLQLQADRFRIDPVPNLHDPSSSTSGQTQGPPATTERGPRPASQNIDPLSPDHTRNDLLLRAENFKVKPLQDLFVQPVQESFGQAPEHRNTPDVSQTRAPTTPDIRKRVRDPHQSTQAAQDANRFWEREAQMKPVHIAPLPEGVERQLPSKRVYKCDCGKEFERKDNLKRHQDSKFHGRGKGRPPNSVHQPDLEGDGPSQQIYRSLDANCFGRGTPYWHKRQEACARASLMMQNLS
ncbi:hypothetical protein T439DRAFT_320200 [Meredithblackwellia eburnea MCA 4105]